jgi:hypothetical protein
MSTYPAPETPLNVKTKYSQYKEATNALGKWLVIAAPQTLSTFTPVQGDKEGHGLKSGDYLALTEQIVNAKPRIRVPARVVKLAEITYFSRRERNRSLRGEDLESDERHEHFITIIQQVYEKLSSHFNTDVNRKGDGNGRAVENLQSSFGQLEVDNLVSEDEEEDAEGTEDKVSSREAAEETARTAKKKTKKSKKARDREKAKKRLHAYTQENFYLDEDEDPYFVLHCLLLDLDSLREYLKGLWSDYREGKVDLTTVR